MVGIHQVIKHNLGGVSRDHMIAVRDGFNLGIDPKLLSHPANCKLTYIMKHFKT
jgi:hypothetical protein